LRGEICTNQGKKIRELPADRAEKGKKGHVPCNIVNMKTRTSQGEERKSEFSVVFWGKKKERERDNDKSRAHADKKKTKDLTKHPARKREVSKVF